MTKIQTLAQPFDKSTSMHTIQQVQSFSSTYMDKKLFLETFKMFTTKRRSRFCKLQKRSRDDEPSKKINYSISYSNRVHCQINNPASIQNKINSRLNIENILSVGSLGSRGNESQMVEKLNDPSCVNIKFYINQSHDNNQKSNAFASLGKSEQFQQFSFAYLRQKFGNQSNNNNFTSNENTGMKIFSYMMGIYENEHLEILQKGYSTGYLQLIGIDLDQFTSLILREKSIDLNKNDTFNDHLEEQDLSHINKSNFLETYQMSTQSIVTLDGFEISVKQSYQRVELPNFSIKKQKAHQQQQKLLQQQIECTIQSEFMLIICEIDVDETDLCNLISYRNERSLLFNQASQSQQQYEFEDIEYSVQCEQFIEKYYQERLVKLKKMQEKNQKWTKTCFYKNLNIQSFHQHQQK